MIGQTVVNEHVANWSLKEKVGQLFILAFPGKSADAAEQMIAEYNLGGCYLSQDNAETFAEARALNQSLDQILEKHNRLPLLLGVDQEGAWGVLVGESNTGPGNLALGVPDNVQGTSRMYRVIGEEMRSAGFNCILGPCCDVNFNPASPIIDTRSFGDQPAKVSAHCAAAVSGLHDGGIVACAKHFPGHGDTQGDSHREIPQVDKSYDELRANDLAPFAAAIDASVDMVMTSHILYPQLDPTSPATLSSEIIEKVLHQDLGFDGIIISDSMNMGAIQHHYDAVDAAVQALAAGVTMIMLSEEHYDHSLAYFDKQVAMIQGVVAAVEQGRLDESVIDEAVKRVVRFKYDKLEPQIRYQDVDLVQNRTIALQAAAEGVTWVRGGLDELQEKPLYLLNATPDSSYHNLVNPRGIGPNQAESAYSRFAQELKSLHPDCREVTVAGLPCADDGNIIVVTENYPLPGEDFEQSAAQELVAQLSGDYRDLIIVALRSPYDLLAYPDARHYLCAHSSRIESAEVTAQILMGQCEPGYGTAVSQVS
ncbi:glycosyl hydrolase family 3 [Photobacterium aquae]|uniref:Glycosyl hydrolase family 3 n=1 Tax=Photobacterium aquae TaxID=1195763 RepID=A0A0J1GWC1_9GAMM|nr:glycoside hydrolase family 3 N-terminal domain-containing protein [Photobacterium aquae]KLV03699.1 glycosyl hydrolase family 3 [Photobacterium aquae]